MWLQQYSCVFYCCCCCVCVSHDQEARAGHSAGMDEEEEVDTRMFERADERMTSQRAMEMQIKRNINEEKRLRQRTQRCRYCMVRGGYFLTIGVCSLYIIIAITIGGRTVCARACRISRTTRVSSVKDLGCYRRRTL